MGDCDAFTDIPVPAKEGCGASVERVGVHGGLFNRVAGEDREAAAKRTAVVEFSMWEEKICMLPYGEIVFLREAFLKADNIGAGIGRGEAVGDFGDSLMS